MVRAIDVIDFGDLNYSTIVQLMFHMLDPGLTDGLFKLKTECDDDGEGWSAEVSLRFAYGKYTTALVKKFPSLMILKVLETVPFTDYDIVCDEDCDGGCLSCTWAEYQLFDVNEHVVHMMKDVFPVFTEGQCYFLNIAQKIEFDRISAEAGGAGEASGAGGAGEAYDPEGVAEDPEDVAEE
jgi:hypothetical protein